MIKDLNQEMNLAAAEMDFEKAALFRDQMLELKNQHLDIPKTVTSKDAKKFRFK